MEGHSLLNLIKQGRTLKLILFHSRIKCLNLRKIIKRQSLTMGIYPPKKEKLPIRIQLANWNLSMHYQLLAKYKVYQLQHFSNSDIIIDKFCTMSEGIRSIKLKDVGGMPISAMLIRLLLGDGDKKRTARRKLLSPICKAIGCSISEDMLVVNVGQAVKDNKDSAEEYMFNLQQNQSKKQRNKKQL